MRSLDPPDFYDEDYASRGVTNMMVPVDFWETSRPKPGFKTVVGFVDVGLVGLIATKHMIEELGLEPIGGIDAPSELPLTPIRDGVVQYPIGLYYKHPWLVISPEVPLPATLIYPIASAILDYVERRGTSEIISLTGLASLQRIKKEPSTFWIVNDPDLFEEETMRKIARVGEPLKDGVLYGPTAVLLKLARGRGIPGVTVLAEAFPDFPDPGAAAKVLDALSKIYDVEINTQKLIEDSERIKARLQEMANRAKEVIQERPRSMMYA
ncbi:protein of unknown function DUF75 [Ignicoccus hospitalis KIN4/I]|uniref:Proteasome assembly chaperone family protein n=2 Tax=Ignicoccus TaxID=54258 RepID=A8A8X6_IGNH4|nr:protein of unknown function DUF75 [Ignicoccus hospitalis KIN4/I]